MTKKKDEINIAAAVIQTFRSHCETYQETGEELAELIDAELRLHRKKSDKASEAKCEALFAALKSVKAGISVMQAFNSMKPSAYQQAMIETFHVARKTFLGQNVVENRATTQASPDILAPDPVYDLLKKVRSFNKHLLPAGLNVLVGEDQFITVPMDYENLSALEVKTEAEAMPALKTKPRPNPMHFLAPPKKSYPAAKAQTRSQKTKEQPLQDVIIHIREEQETKEASLPFLSSDETQLQIDIQAAQELIKELMIEVHKVEKNKNSKNRTLAIQYEVLTAGLDCLNSGKQLMECALRGQTKYLTQFKEAYNKSEEKFRELIRNNEILYQKSEPTYGLVCLAKILLKIPEEPFVKGLTPTQIEQASENERILWGIQTASIPEARETLESAGFFYTNDQSSVTELKTTSLESLKKDIELNALLEELGKIAEKINPLGSDLFRRPYTAQEQAKLKMLEAITHLVYVGCHTKKTKSVEQSLGRVKNLLDQYHEAYTILGLSIIDKPIMKIIALVEDSLHPKQSASQQPGL